MEASTKAGLAYKLLTALIVLGLVVAVVGMVEQYSRAAGSGGTLQVGAEVRPENVSLDLPKGLKAAKPIPVIVGIDNPNLRQLALSIFRDLLFLAMFLIAVLLLRAMLKSVRDGEAFVKSNVTRLRKLGILLLAYPLAGMLASVALGGVLAGTPQEGVVSNGFTLDLSPFAAAFGVFILAEVFAQGLQLREDVEGTV